MLRPPNASEEILLDAISSAPTALHDAWHLASIRSETTNSMNSIEIATGSIILAYKQNRAGACDALPLANESKRRRIFGCECLFRLVG